MGGAERVANVWEEAYPPGVDWAAPIPVGTVHGLLEATAARVPDAPAIEYADRIVTYGALRDAVDALAAGFVAAGWRPGEVVALYLPNTPWHPVTFFAALKAGLFVAHLSPLDAPRELAFKVQDSGARAVVTTDLGTMAARAGELGVPVFVGRDAAWGGADVPLADGVTDLATLSRPADGVAFPLAEPGDLALLQYTGGTTGRPKAAMLSHANLTAGINIGRAWRTERQRPPGEQRVIGVLPLFHIYALQLVLLLHVADGNLILLRPKFDPARTLRDIEELRATTFPAVPTMWIALEAMPGIYERDLSSLSWCGSGGAPMPYEVARRVTRLLGQPLTQGWAMTETSASGTRIPEGTVLEPGMVGVPLPGISVKIVALDDASREMGPDEVGEIAIAGPNVCSGYWGQPSLSAGSFAGGYLLTGDVGRMDGRGMVYLVDRKKRMIISGGFNVYPAMIEDAIYEHPDVREAIVIGVPDAYRGEAAKAFVTVREGAGAMTLETLRAFLADKVGKHEMPAALELRDALPKTSVGKLAANVLIEEERARRGT